MSTGNQTYLGDLHHLFLVASLQNFITKIKKNKNCLQAMLFDFFCFEVAPSLVNIPRKI
jgi:hypothetical protein